MTTPHEHDTLANAIFMTLSRIQPNPMRLPEWDDEQCRFISETAAEVAQRWYESWDGLLDWLDRKYPADIFTGESSDPGPRIVALTRQLAESQRQVEELRAAVERVRALHKKPEGPYADLFACSGCDFRWPCKTIKALDALAASEAHES